MSDPKLQRADGCSVFMTLIITVILISAVLFTQWFFQPEEPSGVTDEVSEQRLKKIEAYKKESDKFSSTVDSFHGENNSSIEKVMREVLESNYQSKQPSAP